MSLVSSGLKPKRTPSFVPDLLVVAADVAFVAANVLPVDTLLAKFLSMGSGLCRRLLLRTLDDSDAQWPWEKKGILL